MSTELKLSKQEILLALAILSVQKDNWEEEMDVPAADKSLLDMLVRKFGKVADEEEKHVEKV